MVKYLLLVILIILDIGKSQAQIPNGGFELWEEVLNYEKPSGWWTNQDTLYTRFEKDTISLEGNYSLKIISEVNSSWLGCESRAGINVYFGTTLPSNSTLTFYVKTIPFDSAQKDDVYLKVFVFVFDSSTQLNTYEWTTYTTVKEFTKVEIPLPDENINALSIFIYGGAGTSPWDGPCLGRSISWIDGMAIDSKTSDKFSLFQEKPVVSVYPNPSSGLVNVSCSDEQIIGYELYSLIGELLNKGEIDNGQLIIHEKGTYILKLSRNSGTQNIYFYKLIIVE